VHRTAENLSETFAGKKERFPDFAPFLSYLTMIGMDTLALRMELHMENTMKMARFLGERPEVKWINYAGLEDHPSHENVQKLFGDRGFGGLLAFAHCSFQNSPFGLKQLESLFFRFAKIYSQKTS